MIPKTLTVALLGLLVGVWLPFVVAASGSQEPIEVDAGMASITFECEMHFKAGRQIEILDCKIVGLVPHLESGE